MGKNISHPHIQKLREPTFTEFMQPFADCAGCWLNHSVVIKHEFKNLLLCLIIEPQSIQNLFRNITAWHPMTVEVPTVFIFSVALWLSDVVE